MTPQYEPNGEVTPMDILNALNQIPEESDRNIFVFPAIPDQIEWRKDLKCTSTVGSFTLYRVQVIDGEKWTRAFEFRGSFLNQFDFFKLFGPIDIEGAGSRFIFVLDRTIWRLNSGAMRLLMAQINGRG